MGNASSLQSGVVVKEWTLPGDHILRLVHDVNRHSYELKVDSIELSSGYAG
jgi:hypothetical protein